MAASHPCGSCKGVDMTALGLGVAAPEHCHGRSDRPAAPGVLGGYVCSCPCRFSPRELFDMAERQFPHLPKARAERYKALMVEAGHIVVKRKPGESANLPCGWPHREQHDFDGPSQ